MKYFLCLFLLLSLSCSKSAYQLEDTLVVAIDSAPKTLDPRYATDAYGQRINSLIFQALVRISDDFGVEPELASKWNYDQLTYTFYIPQKWTFSNGDPLTKEDILFTFKEYQKSSSPFSGAFKVIEKIHVDKEDENFVLKIKLKEFRASFLTDLVTLKFLPKKLVKKYGDDFSFHLIGSGPYQLKREDINTYILSKNQHYPDNPAKTENIHFKVIQDQSTRYLKMKKGELDIAPSVISPLRVKEFQKNQNFRVIIQSGLSMNYILLNLKNPFLKKIKNRQAIAHALDIPKIIEHKLEGFAEPATSILSPSNLFHHKELSPHKYKPEKAQKLLDKSDDYEKLVIKTSNSVEAIENAKIISYQLEKIGIETKTQSYEWGTFYGDISSGNYDLALMRWIGATDPDIYRIALHSSEFPPGRNRGYYANKKVDEFLDLGLKEDSLEKRKALYNKAQEIIHKELPYIPLWYNQQITIVHKRVSNYHPRANGDFLGLLEAQKKSTP